MWRGFTLHASFLPLQKGSKQKAAPHPAPLAAQPLPWH